MGAFEPGDEMKLTPVLHKFLEYYNHRKNITIFRHKCFTYRQQEGQNFHDFVTELKKLNSKCEFDSLQDSLIKEMILCGTKYVVPFVKGFFENATSLCPKQLVHGAGHAAEETRKHAHEILRSQPTADIDKIFKKKLNNSSQNSRNQNTKDFMKKCKLKHARGECAAYGKVCDVCNKKNRFKVCYPRVGKKVHEIEKDESDEPSDQSNYEFFIETVNIQDSALINQIKNENFDWSITLPSNGIPVSYKMIAELNVTLFLSHFWKSLILNPDLCPVNTKLPAYNNSKIPVLGKWSLTLMHKKDHFDVSFKTNRLG